MRNIWKFSGGQQAQEVARIEVKIDDAASVLNCTNTVFHEVRFYDLRDRYIGGISGCQDPIAFMARELEQIG